MSNQKSESSAVQKIGFEEALDAVLPMLHDMKKSLRRTPKATRSSLEKLTSVKDTSKITSKVISHTAPDSPSVKKPAVASMQTAKIATAPPSSEPSTPVIDDGRLPKLEALKKSILTCARCPNLVSSRTQVVYGVGSPFAELMFVGEAPGEEEDLQGEPFVGRSGREVLNKMIAAMEYTRDDLFIANVLKCRPDMPEGESGNRKPKPAEMATCLPWLREQIALIKPKVLVTLGATAIEGLLGESVTMRDVRGKWLDYHGVPLMPTYHPAYILRNQTLAEKRKVWEDMLLVMEKLGRPISAKQRSYFLPKP
jgi:DNA polymerase